MTSISRTPSLSQISTCFWCPHPCVLPFHFSKHICSGCASSPSLCRQFPLCASPFCHACLPRGRQNGSAKAHPQPHLSIPLASALVVAFRTKSLSYTSVCKAQRGRPPSSVFTPSRASFGCNGMVSLVPELDPAARPLH